MKIAAVAFVVPVRVPGRPGRHPDAVAGPTLDVDLVDGFVRLAGVDLITLVPLSNVCHFVPIEPAEAPATAPKKRGAK